jgi:hypothetical protein
MEMARNDLQGSLDLLVLKPLFQSEQLVKDIRAVIRYA